MTIKVISKGKLPVETREATCRKCSTVFTFERSDIEQDRDGSYVRCPVCNSFIAKQATKLRKGVDPNIYGSMLHD